MSAVKILALASLASLAVAQRGQGYHNGHDERPWSTHAGFCGDAPSSTCTSSICADYVNECGQTYGGCYPACSGYTTPTFTPPPCTTTSPGVTSTPASCLTCSDIINDCGQTYGGCFDGCQTPSPSFTNPGCPTTTPTPTIATITTSGAGCSICADYINSCGQTYGGCYDSCKTPTPSFSDPGCPTTTPTTTTGPTTTAASCILCEDFVNSCGQTYGGCVDGCKTPNPTFSDPGCPTTTPTTTSAPTTTAASCILCEDLINSCGQTYGGCVDGCKTPNPTFSDPGCPTTTPTTTTSPTTTSVSTPASCILCEDFINSCGQTYGGCVDGCKTPDPTFSDPGCPTASTTA